MNRAAEKDFASLFRLPQPHSRLESISSIITISSVFTAAVLTAILYFTFLLEDVNHEYSLLAATFFLGVSVYTPVSYTHLRAHETDSYLVCRLLLAKHTNLDPGRKV